MIDSINFVNLQLKNEMSISNKEELHGSKKTTKY